LPTAPDWIRVAFGWVRRLDGRRKGDDVRERIEGNGFGRAQVRLAPEEPQPLPLTGRGTTKIAIGIRDVEFHQQVQDFIGRDPRFEIVGAAVDGDRLVSVLSERGPDAAVLCPTLARELRHPALQGAGRPLVVVAEEMTVPVLREAIEAGAAAVFSWPEERDELARSALEDAGSRGE
jgi:methylmalonyl-CoA mutase cobalamin-binding subunit